jgi:hypothetical protein
MYVDESSIKKDHLEKKTANETLSQRTNQVWWHTSITPAV